MDATQIAVELKKISAEVANHSSTTMILEREVRNELDVCEAEQELRDLANEALLALGRVQELRETLRHGESVTLVQVIEWYCPACGNHNQEEAKKREVKCSTCKKIFGGRW